jgi:F-type H+-transporting ATPase subunit a
VVGPIPFYFLEIFVGFIQAYVFAFLTLMYFTLGTTPHGHDDAQEEHAGEVEAEAQGRAERALSHH